MVSGRSGIRAAGCLAEQGLAEFFRRNVPRTFFIYKAGEAGMEEDASPADEWILYERDKLTNQINTSCCTRSP